MGGIHANDRELVVGEPSLCISESHCGGNLVAFEDDGFRGVFYACTRVALGSTMASMRILDALHIYEVEYVAERRKAYRVRIAWSEDGSSAALLIDDFVQAVFDYSGRRAGCRTGRPPARTEFTDSHLWRDDLLAPFGDRFGPGLH